MLVGAVEAHDMIMAVIIIKFLVDSYSQFTGLFAFTFLALSKSVLIVGFNTYLLCFHIYLMKKKLTTYDFIMGRKRKLDSYVQPGQNLSDTNINL